MVPNVVPCGFIFVLELKAVVVMNFLYDIWRRVYGLGFRVKSCGLCQLYGVWCWVWDLGFRV